MREPQPPNLLFYPRTGLLVTPRFYPGFRGVPILMQRKVLRWHPACSLVFEWQPLECVPTWSGRFHGFKRICSLYGDEAVKTSDVPRQSNLPLRFFPQNGRRDRCRRNTRLPPGKGDIRSTFRHHLCLEPSPLRPRHWPWGSRASVGCQFLKLGCLLLGNSPAGGRCGSDGRGREH